MTSARRILPSAPPPRTLVLAALACALAVAAAAGPAARAGPAVVLQDPAEYVALGDSLSSGEGAPAIADGRRVYLGATDTAGDLCHRSPEAYPVEVARALGATLGFHACSGATTADYRLPSHSYDPALEPAQSGWLAATPAGAAGGPTGLVTLSLGGNDAGFTEAVAACVAGKFLRRPSCVAEVAGHRDAVRGLLDDPDPHRRLADLYRDIRARAPAARVLVVGYPRAFPSPPPPTCPTGAGSSVFTRAEMTALNRFTGALNGAVRASARAVPGVRYVDVSGALEGHGLCATGDRWINPLRDLSSASTRNESYHPTVAGQRALAARVLGCWLAPRRCDAPHQSRTGAASPVFTPTRGGAGVAVRPRRLRVGRHSVLDAIRWLSYGGPVAVGSGRVLVDDCDPGCATGTVREQPAVVTLDGPRTVCRARVYAYLHLHTRTGALGATPPAVRTERLHPERRTC